MTSAGVGVSGRCDAHVLAGVIPDGFPTSTPAESMGTPARAESRGVETEGAREPRVPGARVPVGSGPDPARDGTSRNSGNFDIWRAFPSGQASSPASFERANVPLLNDKG